MKIIKPSATVEVFTPNLLETIERAGRVCYKSEDRIAPGTAEAMIRSLMSKHHESVIEHGSITVRVVCDRGISHELVRHRLASFSQESTRYVAYDKDKHGGEMTVIDILGAFPNMSDDAYESWLKAMRDSERAYMTMRATSSTAQEARSVLPNSLKTELVMTANPREWRTVLRLRTDPSAHPQMREIMIPLLNDMASRWPCLFDDL